MKVEWLVDGMVPNVGMAERGKDADLDDQVALGLRDQGLCKLSVVETVTEKGKQS